MNKRINYYAVLNIPRRATAAEVKRAYFRAAKNFHPDRNPDPDAASRFIEVQKAFEVLSNPTSRRKHDRTLSPVRSRRAIPRTQTVREAEPPNFYRANSYKRGVASKTHTSHQHLRKPKSSNSRLIRYATSLLHGLTALLLIGLPIGLWSLHTHNTFSKNFSTVALSDHPTQNLTTSVKSPPTFSPNFRTPSESPRFQDPYSTRYVRRPGHGKTLFQTDGPYDTTESNATVTAPVKDADLWPHAFNPTSVLGTYPGAAQETRPLRDSDSNARRTFVNFFQLIPNKTAHDESSWAGHILSSDLIQFESLDFTN